ncbi:hypothetical protein KY285_026542 [Solanum tuberosum]|nr:hypothetical protein KY285_026542 [Solanum tuberosum]
MLIAFFNKVLAPKHRGRSNYEKEYMALLSVVDKWRQYLQFKHFIYKKGAENRVVDALSRQHEGLGHLEDQAQGQLISTSTCTPTWIQEIVESYNDDPHVQEILTMLSVDSHGPSLWHYSTGVLKKKGKCHDSGVLNPEGSHTSPLAYHNIRQ